MILNRKLRMTTLLAGALALPVAVSCERREGERDIGQNEELGEPDEMGNVEDNAEIGAAGERNELGMGENATDNDPAAATGGAAGVMEVTEDSDFSDNMDQYVGQSVRITGEINNVVGQHAFTIDTDGAIGGDEALVVTTNSQALQFDEGSRVTVLGTVKNLSVSDWETEYGYDLENNLFTNYENKAAVAANSITLANEEQIIGE